ncbi:Glycoprotein 3-alpha-L-fucosyltransferase A [Habropoda laboriosa]|uniref:Fucosyltransferase n=1 Tax=Habropoda laboriosa TaxID=597456 RepID=A0A0L7R2Y2_9HYME|nr:Glycoprotein 3-alpha-L-fucosyltransferase A [Habropoda laboriosa]
MLRISQYIRILLLIFIGSTIFCAIFVTFSNFLSEKIDKDALSKPAQEDLAISVTKWNFIRSQIGKMSLLGRWLLSSEGSSTPPIINKKRGSYLILVWKHGKFLERRHIKRFTNKKFSPWENCTAKRCIVSYRSKDLDVADAVVFHLHLTQSATELPTRTKWNQKWIFLTDESPMHTFLYGNQELWKYNGLFNWSMTYRMDSDVPVPYGRTISRSFEYSQNKNFSKDFIKKLKTKLVTVMGSNCAGTNRRWHYVSELKLILGNDLDIYGKCLNEYITEKVFWHGYHKLAIPVIMGAPKKNCEQLLPPRSFLHVNDFANPTALANYIHYLNQHDDKYFEYHEWRKYYKVINEHGYFGSISKHYCRICEALHYNFPVIKAYEDIESFWNKKRDCTL